MQDAAQPAGMRPGTIPGAADINDTANMSAIQTVDLDDASLATAEIPTGPEVLERDDSAREDKPGGAKKKRLFGTAKAKKGQESTEAKAAHKSNKAKKGKKGAQEAEEGANDSKANDEPAVSATTTMSFVQLQSECQRHIRWALQPWRIPGSLKAGP